MTNKSITLFLSFLFVLIPFLGKSQLNCYSLQAPEITIEGLEKLAVMNFQNRTDANWRYGYTNDNGSQLADYMVALLLEEHRGVYTVEGNKEDKVGMNDLTFKKFKEQKKAKKFAKGTNFMERYRTDVYTIVERSQLDKIMAEQSLGASGAVSDSDAKNVGELLGLDVIITGGYSTDVATSHSQGSRSSSGSVSYSAKKKASVDVTMKIISIETGQVLSMVNKTVSKKASKSGKSTSEAISKLPSDEQMIRDCLDDVSKQLVSYFAPTFVYQALEIEKPASKDYKDEFSAARDLVKEDDLSGAFSIVKEVYDADPYDAAMAHNMGVLFEAVGNFDQSIEYHKVAYELDDSKDHKEALERALNSKEALVELGKLGVDISPYKFDENAAKRLNIEKVKTDGNKTDRFEVFTVANSGSDVAAKVPGDTEFEKLSEVGDFIEIKLLGGKSGFINKKDLD